MCVCVCVFDTSFRDRSGLQSHGEIFSFLVEEKKAWLHYVKHKTLGKIYIYICSALNVCPDV